MCGASSASNEKKAELIEDRGHWKGRSEDLEKELGGRTARRTPAGGSLLGALLRHRGGPLSRSAPAARAGPAPLCRPPMRWARPACSWGRECRRTLTVELHLPLEKTARVLRTRFGLRT